MFNYPDQSGSYNPDNSDSNYMTNPYWIMITCLTLLTMGYALVRYAESNNRLNYEDRSSRIIAGFLQMFMRAFHISRQPLDVPKEGKALITAGPHRTGWEAIALASMMEGNPPQFLATDGFSKTPGVAGFLKRFKAIIVKSEPKPDNSEVETLGTKDASSNRKANSNVIKAATEVLNNDGCVALFPQGNFAYIGKETPMIYSGAARMAIQTQTPIHVVRLDGFWSLTNPLIPMFIRNNRKYYRAFISGFHANNIKTNLCHVIDFHLRPENKDLPEEEIIQEINAQLFAFYRHTEELTPTQIAHIKTQISEGKHREIWHNKFSRNELEKSLTHLEKEYKALEKENTLTLDTP